MVQQIAHSLPLLAFGGFEGSFKLFDTESLVIRTEDLWCRRDFSGDNVSLFWGLINICDY